MKAPKEILDTWKLQREHGDLERIHEETNISRITLTSALRTGNMSESTFKALRNFFSEKRKAEKQLIKEALK